MNSQFAKSLAILGLALVVVGGSVLMVKGAERNLLTNGSFEQGQEPGGFTTMKVGDKVPGWTVSKGTVDYIGSYFPSANGKRHFDMDGTPGPGGLKQTFVTEPGKTYTLTFSMAGNPQGGPDKKTLKVNVGSKSQVFTHGSDTNWTAQKLTFTASAPQTTLEFTSTDADGGNCGPLLDNVSVTQAVAPVTHKATH